MHALTTAQHHHTSMPLTRCQALRSPHPASPHVNAQVPHVPPHLLRPAAQATMPITVFVVGIMLGTEKFSPLYAANMMVVAVGVATASFGELHATRSQRSCRCSCWLAAPCTPDCWDLLPHPSWHTPA